MGDPAEPAVPVDDVIGDGDDVVSGPSEQVHDSGIGRTPSE